MENSCYDKVAFQDNVEMMNFSVNDTGAAGWRFGEKNSAESLAYTFNQNKICMYQRFNNNKWSHNDTKIKHGWIYIYMSVGMYACVLCMCYKCLLHILILKCGRPFWIQYKTQKSCNKRMRYLRQKERNMCVYKMFG